MSRLRKGGAILSISLHAFLACVVTTLHFFKPCIPFNYIFRGKSHGLKEVCTSGNVLLNDTVEWLSSCVEDTICSPSGGFVSPFGK